MDMYTMSGPPIRLYQNILDDSDDTLRRLVVTYTIQDLDIAASDLSSIFDHADPIGISPGYSTTGKLISLAIADDKNCRIIEFKPNGRRDGMHPQTFKSKGRQILQDQILCRSAGEIYAFDMGPLAMSLYCDLGGLRVTNAVDIQSAFSGVDRKPLTAIKIALGNSVEIKVRNLTDVFSNPLYDAEDKNHTSDFAQRAWVSQFLARSRNGAGMFDKVSRIDTKKLDFKRLDMLAKVANDSLRLDYKKPSRINHEFSQSVDPKNDQSQLISSNFKNKFRSDTCVEVEVEGKFSIPGVVEVNGKLGNLITDLDLVPGKMITKVTSIGRNDHTTAEARLAATVLQILQGSQNLLLVPWIQNIWFPPNDNSLLIWPKEWSKQSHSPSRSSIQKPAPAATQPQPQLNLSQRKAVDCMISSEDNYRITLIQGPPGTGKTFVIATFVQDALHANKGGIWIVGQSNIAVKNIAEKLISVGLKDWRLLISKNFYFEWHEHLYDKLPDKNVIPSDMFNTASSPSALGGCQVILCTLAMLSNPNVKKFTKEIPFKTMVVDEASQIEIGNYIPIFINFKHSLCKLCFIGDDKQLSPFGQEDLRDLQSIFQIPHLQKIVIFLNTQYRMPPQIGNIISKLVYEERLKSNPSHLITDNFTACYLVEALGKEKALKKGAFTNEAEASHIIHLARKLQEQNKNYRIITPYEDQRNYIEALMKEEDLKWGDKCFNVDSFQGNEDDFIIISIVRTSQLGFLQNFR